jgi:hypothetical protein
MVLNGNPGWKGTARQLMGAGRVSMLPAVERPGPPAE